MSAHLRTTFASDADYWRYPHERLFRPLGIARAEIATDPAGGYLASGMMYMPARDWLRIGVLMARRGAWGDRQLVPAEWVDLMRTPGGTGDATYGFQTWLYREAGAAGPASAIELRGFGGNRMTVFPEADVVLLRLGYDFDESWDQMGMFVQPVIGTLNQMAS